MVVTSHEYERPMSNTYVQTSWMHETCNKEAEDNDSLGLVSKTLTRSYNLIKKGRLYIRSSFRDDSVGKCSGYDRYNIIVVSMRESTDSITVKIRSYWTNREWLSSLRPARGGCNNPKHPKAYGWRFSANIHVQFRLTYAIFEVYEIYVS